MAHCRALGSGRAARAALQAPPLDQVHVSSCRDAQLNGALVQGGVWPGAVPCQDLARIPGQQVGPPASDLGELGQRGSLAPRGRWAGDGIPATYVRDLRQQMIISMLRITGISPDSITEIPHP
jgi:hypothetical protein